MDNITLIITSPCGNHELHYRTVVVPRIGETITARDSGGNAVFGGTVKEVHYGLRMGFGVNEGNPTGGIVVSVWLEDDA